MRNARVVPFIQLRYVLERSAPGNLSGVTCGVLKASAEQQGVQDQRHDGVLSGKISIGTPCMLHGNLHQMHASSISCMLNRWVFTSGKSYAWTFRHRYSVLVIDVTFIYQKNDHLWS